MYQLELQHITRVSAYNPLGNVTYFKMGSFITSISQWIGPLFADVRAAAAEGRDGQPLGQARPAAAALGGLARPRRRGAPPPAARRRPRSRRQGWVHAPPRRGRRRGAARRAGIGWIQWPVQG